MSGQQRRRSTLVASARRALFGLIATAPWALARTTPPLRAIGIENQYADVIQQVGGSYVRVTAIETNPNTDPHSFEASPLIARQIASASLIVENGLGYDGWANKIIAATPGRHRLLIDVGHLLHLPGSARNPHVWYDPATMPAVADAVAADLSALDPAHAALFKANAASFDASLKPWITAITAFKAHHPNVAVAVSEPVGDDLLQALGMVVKTPFTLQTAIMNGTDPSPQDIATETRLLSHHAVRLLVYNRQVTDPLTRSFLHQARKNHIPVVAMYETMPTGYRYQSWMLAEVRALDQAVTQGRSTRSLMAHSH